MTTDDDHLLPELIGEQAITELIFQDATVQPWERMNGESARQYSYFCAYRDLGPSRTVNAVVDNVGGQVSSLRTLSSVHGWVKRAEAYDDFLERQERKLIERGRLEARQRQINLGQQLQNKAMEGLMILNPYTATPRDLALMADIGAKLERAGRGEIDTKRLEVTGAGGGPVEMSQSLDPADRREFLASIQQQISQRLGQLPVTQMIVGEVIGEETETGEGQ